MAAMTVILRHALYLAAILFLVQYAKIAAPLRWALHLPVRGLLWMAEEVSAPCEVIAVWLAYLLKCSFCLGFWLVWAWSGLYWSTAVDSLATAFVSHLLVMLALTLERLGSCER